MSRKSKWVEIYTDGSCIGNPGTCGWAAILRYGPHEKVLTGGLSCGTSNRAELVPVIEALKALKRPCRVSFYSDSQYVVRCATREWRAKSNMDLWREYTKLASAQLEILPHWVRGHSGHPENERCDKLAGQAAVDHEAALMRVSREEAILRSN